MTQRSDLANIEGLHDTQNNRVGLNLQELWRHLSKTLGTTLVYMTLLLLDSDSFSPTACGFIGLNAALKQTLALKQDTCLPANRQGLLKTLILSGKKETFAVTTAIPLLLQPQTLQAGSSIDL